MGSSQSEPKITEVLSSDPIDNPAEFASAVQRAKRNNSNLEATCWSNLNLPLVKKKSAIGPAKHCFTMEAQHTRLASICFKWKQNCNVSRGQKGHVLIRLIRNQRVIVEEDPVINGVISKSCVSHDERYTAASLPESSELYKARSGDTIEIECRGQVTGLEDMNHYGTLSMDVLKIMDQQMVQKGLAEIALFQQDLIEHHGVSSPDRFKFEFTVTSAMLGLVGQAAGDEFKAFLDSPAGRKRVDSVLKRVGGVAGAAGIAVGAVAAVDVVLSIIKSLFGHSAESHVDVIKSALRSVIKDEQSKDVNDRVEHALERMQLFYAAMHDHQADAKAEVDEKFVAPVSALADAESKLALALTKVKNNMLEDNLWKMQFIHSWMNGAYVRAQLARELFQRRAPAYTRQAFHQILNNIITDIKSIYYGWCCSITVWAGGDKASMTQSGKSITWRQGGANFCAEAVFLVEPQLRQPFSLSRVLALFQEMRDEPENVNANALFQRDGHLDQLVREALRLRA